MFYSKKLKKFKNIRHCFFSRKNGFSKGIYRSLNCGLGSKDNKKLVIKNLKLINKKIKTKDIITLKQIHSNKVICFEKTKVFKKRFFGDAIISKITKTGIGILTADCVPILLYDPQKKIIGCIHSGWKGALNGIIKNTIKKFTNLGSNPKDIVVAVGPCIGKKNYEVGYDLFKKFISLSKKNTKFFTKKNFFKYLFDLRGFINQQLISLKITKIDNIKLDTFSNKNIFFSHRRSLVKQEKDYGRCISVILMT